MKIKCIYLSICKYSVEHTCSGKRFVRFCFWHAYWLKPAVATASGWEIGNLGQ